MVCNFHILFEFKPLFVIITLCDDDVIQLLLLQFNICLGNLNSYKDYTV